jgi:DNA-binding response OmpR family regulator
MDLTCRRCSAKFRAAIGGPLAAAVRLSCPACSHEMVLRPRFGHLQRSAVVADEDRPFRAFLAHQLQEMGFEVSLADDGDSALDLIRSTAPQLVIINVYLPGKLGVEVAEQVKNDRVLSSTKIVLIGALFRANRFRANPTNLYGADEYIEELIPEKEFRRIIDRLLPTNIADVRFEEREREEARRLARLILSDIIIYHPQKVEEGIRNNSFFEVLRAEIDEGRQYYESRVPLRLRRDSEIFNETLRQFVDMKRDELAQTS